ncbi:coiled-coil domain-containing protein 105 [Rhinatrema bivittatum]|uniref:coiled-coil domain-containing protein 105 n=1 Tax=Rhinatrema bivittatum TaxID=194408 RepID=UPI0011262EA0|nr:coiled-coil domain-containing protein 105 [Rhinatrema bivittatum]XP_029440504.1 coiled-coil domain-containing protein 105 [Rhinatrema bivittatum]
MGHPSLLEEDPPVTEPVGSDAWREATYGIVRMAKDLAKKSGRVITSAPAHQSRSRKYYPEETGREDGVAEKRLSTRSGQYSVDRAKTAPARDAVSKDTNWITNLPLPFFREFLAMQDNNLAHDYSRQTRLVVARLIRAISFINDEISKLLKERETLEHTLANIRKDILTSKQSVILRSFRPISEKVSDRVDALLASEQLQLSNIKRKLDEDLGNVHQQLQALDLIRKELRECKQERNRVLDLINHSLTGVLQDHEQEFYWRRSPPCSLTPKPKPQKVNPFEPFNTECKQVINMVLPVCDQSQNLRRNIREHIKEALALQEALNKSINGSLKQKTEETFILKGQLHLASGEMRKMKQYCQHLYDNMDTINGLSLGPVYSGDLEAREHLDRPIIRIHQRHAGTRLPEATNLVKGTNLVQNAMKNMSNDMDRLHTTRLQIEDNIRDKRTSYNVDNAVIYLRRRRANHCWSIEQGKQLICD